MKMTVTHLFANPMFAIVIGCYLLVTLSCGSANKSNVEYPTRVPTPTAVDVTLTDLNQYIGSRVSVAGTLAEPADPNTLLRCDNTDDWHNGKYLCHWFHLVGTEGEVYLAIDHWTPDIATQRALYSSFAGGIDWEEDDQHVIQSTWIWDRNWDKVTSGDMIKVTGTLIQTAEQKEKNTYFLIVELVDANP
jgi:hypothetical protein